MMCTKPFFSYFSSRLVYFVPPDIRVALDLIFLIRPGPDLAGFGTADPVGAGAGAKCS